MDIYFNKTISEKYKSNSQKARIFTEDWVNNNAYCIRCGSDLYKAKNNRPVEDFICKKCNNIYELKSKQRRFNKKITDGAYRTMINRITSKTNPDFLLLTYDVNENSVNDFFAIPKHFFIPDIIEKRKPLADSARRAGWVGCNILLKDIPKEGKVFIVDNKKIIKKEKVLGEFSKTSFINETTIEGRSWIMDILNCIDRINNEVFFLEDIYFFECDLYIKHPRNNNVRAKIRQQLQILRDKGIIEFVARGKYRKVYNNEII